MSARLTRRDFGKTVGAAGLSGVARTTEAEATQSASAAAPQRPAAGQADVYTFFTSDEAAFVEAAVARLIPADDLGPGAKEAGVAVFIDRQLSGAFGSAAKWYTRGPWGESAPEQGYQLPLTPRELYRLAIAAIDRKLIAERSRPFARLGPAEQDEVLTALEGDALDIADVPVRTFFEMLLGNTVEGYFADPVYGGNRDKAGWHLVGFPGVAASYLNRVGRHNEPYRVEPVSISDVLERRVPRDQHGHVVHQPLDDPAKGGR